MTMTGTEHETLTRLQWLAIGVQSRVAYLPRLVRILLAAGFAVAVLLAIFPLIDNIYVRYFFDLQTVILPSLVAVGIAGIMYIAGWYLLVGTIGDEKIKQSASPALVIYFAIGLVAMLIDIILFLHGLSITDTFAG